MASFQTAQITAGAAPALPVALAGGAPACSACSFCTNAACANAKGAVASRFQTSRPNVFNLKEDQR